MHLVKIALGGLLLFAAAMPVICQDKPAAPAIVTVYAPGSYWKGSGRAAVTLGIGNKPAPSMGDLFDGDQKLVMLTPGRFISLEFAPGPHHLSASVNPKKANEDEAIDLDAKAGEHYFLRLTTTAKGAYVVQIYRAHLEQVTCTDARAEADTTKAVDVKKVVQEERPKLVNEAYFPRCAQ